ncbi:MAG TPA: hypothetical protein VLJ37_07945 [bacterium]|nr:hypothetical protein [bacterium]
MYKIDDPLFALILRFVGYELGVSYCDDEDFVQRELKAIESYIDGFPQAEQERHAMEWVEGHANEYRKKWEKDFVRRTISGQRCADCPISKNGRPGNCPIHDQLSALLEKYIGGDVTASGYVKDSLELLSRYKEHLKIKLSELRNDP